LKQQLQTDLKQRLETKVAENQKMYEENLALKHDIMRLNISVSSANKQLTEKDDRIGFLERRLVELAERNGLLVHGLDEATRQSNTKEKMFFFSS
jgi:chromosome segregation ATPase